MQLLQLTKTGTLYIQQVRDLLNGGVSPDSLDRPGNSPLLNAVQCGSVELTRLLLESNAEPNGPVGGRLPPLLEATNLGNSAIVEMLLAARADPMARAPKSALDQRDTALHIAALKGDYALAARLLDSKASARAKDQFGFGPLAWATTEKLAHLLLDAGAPVEQYLWCLPLSADGTTGHRVERVRLEAKRAHDLISYAKYVEDMRRWRRENQIEEPCSSDKDCLLPDNLRSKPPPTSKKTTAPQQRKQRPRVAGRRG